MRNGNRGLAAADPAALWTGWWSAWTEQMSETSRAWTPMASPWEAARRMRSVWIDAWSDWWDDALRSSWFREVMQQSMTANIQLQKQMNDFLGQLHHQLQGASRQDIDQLMLAVRHLEQRLVDCMERRSWSGVNGAAAQAPGATESNARPEPAETPV